MIARRLAVSCCVVAVLALLGGCAVSVPPADDPDPGPGSEPGVDADTAPDPAAVFEGAFVHADDLADVRGERTTRITDGTETVTEVAAVAERPYTDYRSEVLESSDPSAVGDAYVSNASASWWYDADTNTGSVYEVAEPFDDAAVREARAAEADRQRELYDLTYRGTEEIAGREAHVVDVAAKNESVAEGVSVLVGDTEFVYALETVDPADELEVREQTIWIDATYEYPLKEELVFEGPSGGRHELVERYDEIEFNVGLEDETFAFEPPENATIEDPSGE